MVKINFLRLADNRRRKVKKKPRVKLHEAFHFLVVLSILSTFIICHPKERENKLPVRENNENIIPRSKYGGLNNGLSITNIDLLSSASLLLLDRERIDRYGMRWNERNSRRT